MISHACGLVLLVTASSAFLQHVNGNTCCSCCNALLFASSMHSVVCLCLSACAIVPLNVLPVPGGKSKLLHAEYDAKVCVCAQVEKAAKLFKQAGCVQSDIKAALTSHIKHDEIDIPQDEPEEAKKVSSCSPPLSAQMLLNYCANWWS